MPRKLLTIGAFFLCALSLFASDFRIQTTNGVPHIEKDGEPVRARWFYGCPTQNPIFIHPGDQRLVLKKESTFSEDCQLTFHFRLPRIPGAYYFDDFQVIDDTTGELLMPGSNFDDQPYGPFLSLPDKSWEIWPRNPQEKYFGAEIVDFPGEPGNKALKYYFTPDSSVDNLPRDPHLYRSPVPVHLEPGKSYTISVRVWSEQTKDVLLTPGYYIPHPVAYRPALIDASGADTVFSRQVKNAHNAGVDFVTTVITIPWPEKGPQDFADVDLQMRHAIAANPGVYIIPRIRLDAPNWWLNSHPTELVRWDPEAANSHALVASVSSKIWLKESLEKLEGTIRYLEATFPDNIAGYHICNLNTWEWFYNDSWQQDFHGYSPCEVAAFREWLSHKYGSTKVLRKAWNDRTATLQTALVPSPEERKAAKPITAVLNPAVHQKIIDHNDFLQDAVADAIYTTAHAVRKIVGEKRLIVYFYGYINIFGGMSRMSACGHLNNRRVLQCPDIDILCSPIDYSDRMEGEAALAMTPGESILRSGKMWFYEDDTRTYLAGNGPLAGVTEYVHDKTHSRNVLLRNTSEEIIRNFGCWWMDLAQIGWYDDPYLWTAMSDLKEMEDKKLANPRPFEPVIAGTASERSAVYTKDAITLCYPAYASNRSQLSRCGASNGMYYLEDVIKNGIPSKVVLVGNAWVLDAQERTALKQQLADKTVIWAHAPGIVDPESGFSLENSQELTGFQLQHRLSAQRCDIRATQEGRNLGLPGTWEVRASATDNFDVVPQEGDEILGVWADNGAPAVVRRGKNFFCASAEVPRELLQAALETAGEHIYTKDEVVFYTDGTNITLHATPKTPAVVHLAFPCPVKVKDIISGKFLTEAPVTSLEVPMQFADTCVLELCE